MTLPTLASHRVLAVIALLKGLSRCVEEMGSTEPPVYYEIRVGGVLHPGGSAWFDGLRVSSDATAAGPPEDR